MRRVCGSNWRAYLSTTGAGGVNARDRIGSGPWFNVKKEQIAANVDELHDRVGLDTEPPALSWNSSHGSRGCGMDALRATGGAGLLYCFAAN